MNTIFIVLPILTILMFDLGLVLKPADFKLIAERPKPVLIGLGGQIILLPLIAWGLIELSAVSIQLSAFSIIGIMLVACSPGGSSSNVFSMLAKGDVALSVTLTACSSIVTLFTLPLIMAWVTAGVGEAVNIHLPVGKLLVQNIVLMVVPISIGFVLNLFRPETAAKIHNVLKRVAMPALVLLVTIFFVQHRQTIVAEIGSLGLMMTALILATTGCGALLARLFRLSGKERRTLVIEIGMQNAAQAITIACSPLIFNNESIAIPAIIYALMMNLVLLAYVGLTKMSKE
ncbi:MAG: bile acid:sodium symporter family protein [Paludibacteraceae bacterium]|jgi:BASS family bile acid:Na+ symporter|nr:bile acid:sodium symporter family protein [Paludibacteraceae bacterium]